MNTKALNASFATLTLNPAIDRTMYFDSFVPNATNKCRRTVVSYGGKGINVSRAMSRLGVKATAYGFMGEGDAAFEKALAAQEVSCRFTKTKSGARVNVKLIASDGSNTEANEPGGPITNSELDALFTELSALSTAFPHNTQNFLIMGGSVPQGVDYDVYKTLCSMLKTGNIHTVCDTSGKALSQVLEERPFMIKPNLAELSSLVSTNISTISQAVDEVFRIYVEYGSRVLCTASENGSIYAGPEGIYTAGCPQVESNGFVGAGDTFLAAFMYEYASGAGIERSMSFAASAAAAKVELEGTELPSNYTEMDKFSDGIRVERIR